MFGFLVRLIIGVGGFVKDRNHGVKRKHAPDLLIRSVLCLLQVLPGSGV